MRGRIDNRCIAQRDTVERRISEYDDDDDDDRCCCCVLLLIIVSWYEYDKCIVSGELLTKVDVDEEEDEDGR